MRRGVCWSGCSLCRCQLTRRLNIFDPHNDRWHGLSLRPCGTSVTTFSAFPLFFPALHGRSRWISWIGGLECFQGFKSSHKTHLGRLRVYLFLGSPGSASVFVLWFDTTDVLFVTCLSFEGREVHINTPLQVLGLNLWNLQ